MKKIIKSIFSMAMSLALAFTAMFSASAAPSRVTGKTKYLSEVALIEASNREEADKILTELKKDENGSFEGMLELDLNEGGPKQVYLAYKTSTNVDDAITDLSVMNMNGNFTMGNYEQLLADTLDSYKAITQDYRTIAAEFKANYEAGQPNALLAYRQMNYYYIERGDNKIGMGDYMLNFPTDDTEFSDMLFRGNLKIIGNLRALMAMGVGDSEQTLVDRISAAFEQAKADPSIYEISAYHEIATNLKNNFEDMKKMINTAEEEIEKLKEEAGLTDEDIEAYKADPEGFSEELDDADVEELNKMSFLVMIVEQEKNCDLEKAFYELLCEISMGDTTLGKYIMETPVLEIETFFPIVAAASAAEALLMKYGSFDDLLLYDVLEENMDIINEQLEEMEKEYEPLSVYHGVQNDLTEGTIGVTGDADLYANASGKSFLEIYGNSATQAGAIGYTLLGVAGVASTIGGIAYLLAKAKLASSTNVANAALREQLQSAVLESTKKITTLKGNADTMMKILKQVDKVNKAGDPNSVYILAQKKLEMYAQQVKELQIELLESLNQLDDIPATKVHMTGAQIFAGSFLIVAGVVAMGFSIWQLTNIYNKYETTYTDIPDNMVHVVSHEDFGDRFVNYQNVPAYYYSDGKLKSRENDLNAYKGNQWVSLYYTKNYEAGYCLTATPDLIATEAARRGYSGIHLFGRTSNYNLNSYCNREDAAPIYLAFKYSTNQKSAVTDVPDIIGSIFSKSSLGIAAVAGFGLGMGVMGLIQKKKKEAPN